MRDEVPSVAKLPTKWGQFDNHVYHEESTGLDHVALMLVFSAKTVCRHFLGFGVVRPLFPKRVYALVVMLMVTQQAKNVCICLQK